MSSTFLMDSAIQHWQRGQQLEKEENYFDAISAYKSGCDSMLKWLQYDKVPQRAQDLKTKCIQYMDHIAELKQFKKEKEIAKAGGGNNNQKAKGEDADKSALDSAISQCIIKTIPDISFKDVSGLEKAKEALTEAVILPKLMPQLFTGNREPWRAILLYGVPGTGKTFIAKALAAECKSTFFAISSSDLISKYVGESERLVRALFEMARSEESAVVFIDEIDSLCSARGGEGENESSKRVKTEFLVQMQGVGKDNKNILILGATNFPENIDPAIRRRFEKRIEITLPEWESRKTILMQNINKTPHCIKPEEVDQLKDLTELFSPSDISVLMKDAIMQPIRELQECKTFCKTEDNKFRICGADVAGAEMISFMELAKRSGDNIIIPEVSIEHVKRAIKTCKKSVGQGDIARINKFTQQFGQEG